MMKKLLTLAAFLVLASLPAMAQDRPLVDVGGGYQYRGFDETFLASPRLTMNGWFATADLNFTNRISLAADITGTYNHGGNGFSSSTIYSYQFGPRIYLLGHQRISPFVHGLFGLAHADLLIPADPVNNFPALDETDIGYSWAGGGGVDFAFTRHWAVRGQADYEATQFFGGMPNQGNVKVGVGLIYRLGGR
jgi:opacity protein-like surface antigen